MAFDPSWLFWTLALGFALGWMASRIDLRQSQRDQRESRRVYDRGLNLLLNEQYDKAIDAFIEVVQQDPDTTELHFALGNLFRRRGELERAVRVHEYLLNRPHLSLEDRHRAQHALAQDFMSGGLFDRADAAWKALIATPYEMEARLALLTLHERSREWAQAADVAAWLHSHGAGDYARRVAHHWCELHLEALGRADEAGAAAALQRAIEAAPGFQRAAILAGQYSMRQNDGQAALGHWAPLCEARAEAFTLVISDYAQTAAACHGGPKALADLDAYAAQVPSVPALRALGELDPAGHTARLEAHLRHTPNLRVAALWLERLERPAAAEAGEAAGGAATQPLTATAEASPLPAESLPLLARAIHGSAQSQARYRCAACGFESQRHFWQCPGCLNWDTYPARCIDEC
jgi:lipopolysaccharide biosynthesis regulator YciM